MVVTRDGCESDRVVLSFALRFTQAELAAAVMAAATGDEQGDS